MNKTKIPCCFCDDFTSSTARGVKIHMRAKHKNKLWMRNRTVRHGRPPKDACEICGMVHYYDDIQLEGRATHVRKLERPKAALIIGRTPEGLAAGQKISLGQFTVPKGVSRIKAVEFLVDWPGRFDLTIMGHVFSYDVRPGYVRRVA
ncbi:MAG: hypothetical protein LN416_09225 [Candidatus Thermoplasmatota archaeon]|nr:hypothetical protein [Candidatus Thermoplasmatota archaeon]